jgi:hypothetical protein
LAEAVGTSIEPVKATVDDVDPPEDELDVPELPPLQAVANPAIIQTIAARERRIRGLKPNFITSSLVIEKDAD